ncbi:hypothetical protein [Pseudarthrobacter sp. SSS035]|uniref:hypothetical protein n=1 Tax=Pseudarthrobacter sp. SSS035 TaxID=2931399 RepID=UPI00200CB675|nr:hypothetical protein [Pseudarthrobacter sp. SSS035]
MKPMSLGAGPQPVTRLGGVAPIGPDTSWCPPGVRGWQSISAYLIRNGDSAVLVDTGVGLHAPQVLDQLRALLDPQAHLNVILTRTEMECCLNLPEIEREFTVDQVWYTGGITVPVTSATARRISVDAGSSIELEAAPGIIVKIYSPLLRLLPVLWVGDPVSRTLLTSDSFCHLLTDEAGLAQPLDVGLLQAFHDIKFGWIADTAAKADTEALAQNIRDIVGDLAWAAIGPGYGGAIVGRDAIESQAGELIGHLRKVVEHAA